MFGASASASSAVMSMSWSERSSGTGELLAFIEGVTITNLACVSVQRHLWAYMARKGGRGLPTMHCTATSHTLMSVPIVMGS